LPRISRNTADGIDGHDARLVTSIVRDVLALGIAT
jgi:hypothetical protein